ncbi:MAG: glycosyltransferase [Cytophagaceae bacterium]|jgi:cellulose synthase/poly-beta-1,6-N-acetylglucosamine synthase-like glycosyltransferase|nr:glycosyltransferase [Cytophagaceae bacterium]
MNILWGVSIAGIAIVAVYCIAIVACFISWRCEPETNCKIQEFPFVSVVVPFKNEEVNLPVLLLVLQNQNYPANKFEVIAVDDHSTDAFKDTVSAFPNCYIVQSIGKGKKDALKTGIVRAKGEIIITTDADCRPTKNWINSTAVVYAVQNPSMIIGPVKMAGGKTFLSRFQAMDYMALQMCGASAAMLRNPVFCSGANLSFRKSEWLEVQNIIEGSKEASGDDVFLLHAFKKTEKKIVFNKNRNSIVTTLPESTLKDFLMQRMRWGGKSRSYSDALTIGLAVIVLFTNLIIGISLLFFPFVSNLVFSVCFTSKLICDYLLIKDGRFFYEIKSSFPEFILFSLMYPFYIVYTALGGLFTNTLWKGIKTKVKHQ